MSCSICSSSCSGDLCDSCASMVVVVAPASKEDQRVSRRKARTLDLAAEGDQHAIRRAVRAGWMAPEVDESYSERRMEAFCGARLSGASMEAAWQEVDALG